MRRWDRKQVGFFLLLAAFVLLSVAMISAVAYSQGSHEILGEEQNYRSLLHMQLEARAKPAGFALTARSRVKLRQLAAVIPGERRTAHVFLPAGKNAKAVESFLGRTRLDLYIFTAKVTTPGGVEVIPLSEDVVGTRSGTISARIESAVRETTLRDVRYRKKDIPANAPFTVVEIGVIGSIAELRKLAESRGDFVFSFRPSARIATAFDARYRCHQEQGPRGCETHIGIPAGAQPEEIGPATRHALATFMKSEDLVAISKRIVDSRQEVEEAARRAPRQRRAAEVILKYPVDGGEIALLLGPPSLELAQMETIVTDGASPGGFVTKHFAPNELAMGDSIEERVDTAWGKERVNSGNAAVRGSDNNVVIRMEVEGTLESLHMLSRSPRVQAVFVDENKVVAQRPDADDPRPERGMKRLDIPGTSAIWDITPLTKVPMPRSEDLRRLARERPKEQRVAVLLLRRDSSVEDVTRLLEETRLKFLNHRPAVVVTPGAPPVTLAPEILVQQSGSLGQQLRGAAVEAGAVEGNPDIRVLRLGIGGEAADLGKLIDDPRVFAVILDSVQL